MFSGLDAFVETRRMFGALSRKQSFDMMIANPKFHETYFKVATQMSDDEYASHIAKDPGFSFIAMTAGENLMNWTLDTGRVLA